MNVSSHAAVFGWRPACWLRVTGPDTAAFLQGQFTNDLRALSPGGCVYGLWLNVKGKVLADSFVVAGEADGRWVGSYFSPASVVKERLESFIIADDVTVEDQTDAWSGLTVFAPVSAVREKHQAVGGMGFIFPGRRDRSEHTEWVFPTTAAAQVRALLAGDMSELTASEMERRRIESAIPAVPADIGPGDLPNEAGLDDEAISYTKGCYLGQEIMARLKSMGQVRRRLVRVAGGVASVPALPAPLFATGRQVGELRSAAAAPDGSVVGLAMVSRLNVQPDTQLAFAADAAPVLRLLDAP